MVAGMPTPVIHAQLGVHGRQNRGGYVRGYGEALCVCVMVVVVMVGGHTAVMYTSTLSVTE